MLLQWALNQRQDLIRQSVSHCLLPNLGGAVYLSGIRDGEERIGNVHVYIWDKSDMGCPSAVRDAAITLMKRHKLDRMVAEISSSNKMALQIAKKVGFHVIGTIRKRRNHLGVIDDLILVDALPEDLEQWAVS